MAGCGSETALPPPAPEAVVPAAGWNGAGREVEIRGRDFYATVTRRLEGEPLQTDTRFRVWLGDRELVDVRWLDSATLTATVPVGLPAGSLALTVGSPSGDTGTVADAYRSFDQRPAELGAQIQVESAIVRLLDLNAVTLIVTNLGETTARAAAPTLSESGSGATLPDTGPTPQEADIDGGQSVEFRWSRLADSVGDLRFRATVEATEAMAGDPISAASAPSDPVTIVQCFMAADCDDGLFCSGVEGCAAGACVPGPTPCSDDGLSCTASCDESAQACNVLAAGSCLIDGSCRVAGEADPANPCRECDPAASPIAWTDDDTNACDDATFCNGSEACVAGACVPAASPPCADDGFACTTTCDETLDACNVVDPGSCLVDGACRAAAEMNPFNPCQECVPATSPLGWTDDDTNPCDDGLFCSGGGSCSAGACAGGAPPCADDGLSCTATCDEAAGACNVTDALSCVVASTCYAAGALDPANPCQECTPAISQTAWTSDDTNACDDGDACTADVCSAGTCTATPICGTPPIARLTLTPRAGTTATVFAADASSSSDLEDPLAALQFRWDWESDGIWDTAFSSTPTANHTYPSLPPGGLQTVALEVQDSAGRSGYARHPVVLSAAGDLVVVTTAADENDPGATPGSPGGTGLSLREAINYVEVTVGAQTITFAGPMTIVLASPLPDLTDAAGGSVVGDAGVQVDGAGTGSLNSGCINLIGSGHRAVALEIFNCKGYGINITGTAAEVIDCVIHDNDSGLWIGGPSSVIGPGNDIGFHGYGIELAAAAIVEGNRIHDAFQGIYVWNTADGATVRQNVITASADAGIQVAGNTDSLTFIHNTLHGNGAEGLYFGNATAGHQVQSNLFTANAGAGIRVGTSTFTAFSHNDYFANAGGDCLGSGCTAQTDAYALDALYLDAAAGDFRLLPGSPVIDLGPDLGLDVNGPEPGSFNGMGPDLGAWEAPAGY